MRIVLDTNIYIAVALHGEFAEDIIEIFTTRSSGVVVVTSEEILLELQRKLKEKFNWEESDIDLFMAKIRNISEVAEVNIKVDIIKRDPKDNKILECALVGKADLIVTADQDLIKLKTFRGIGIIHPKTLTWTFPQYFKKNKRE